jgi:hypothetical protein
VSHAPFYSVVSRGPPSLFGVLGGGQKVAYGTFDGVYFQDLREPNREPIKVLALTDVAQVDVLDDYGLLIVLSGVPFVAVSELFRAYSFFTHFV